MAVVSAVSVTDVDDVVDVTLLDSSIFHTKVLFFFINPSQFLLWIQFVIVSLHEAIEIE